MLGLRASAIAVVVLIGATGAANADGPAGRDYAPALARINWSGVYVGASVGGSWSDTDLTWQIPTLSETRFPSQSASGIALGTHLGAQHQFGRVVAGVEVSFSKLDLDSSETIFQGGLNRLFTMKVDELFTATAKLGYAFDRWLVYAKGGYASAALDLNMFRSSDLERQASSSHRADGWTAGGGLDYMLAKGLSVGVEYTYVKLDDDRSNVNLPSIVPMHFNDINSTIQTVSVRLNFMFNRDDDRPLK
jgi:outer membrane immunogenic protein